MAFVAHSVFGMPLAVAYCLGYCLGTVAGSLVVPVMLSLAEKGLGKEHGVPSILVACCTFENIAAIIFFGIWKAVAFSEAEAEAGIEGGDSDIGMDILNLLIQNLAGLMVGLIAGFGAYLFKFLKPGQMQMRLKAAYVTLLAVSFIFMSDYFKFTDGKFMSCITFGYVCSRFWGNDKPMKKVGWIWFFI